MSRVDHQCDQTAQMQAEGTSLPLPCVVADVVLCMFGLGVRSYKHAALCVLQRWLCAASPCNVVYFPDTRRKQLGRALRCLSDKAHGS